MPTPIWITGWEHGVNPNSNGTGLGNTIAGTPTVVSTPVNSGAYSLRMIGDGVTAQSVQKTFSSPPQIAVARFYIRFSAYPSSATACMNFRLTTAATDVILTVSTAGVISAKVGAGTSVNGPTLSLNTWYQIGIRANITTATWTCDWQIDGVAQTQATEASRPTNDTFAYWRLGTSSTSSTYTVFFDDAVLSATSADYPIGAGGTEALVPTSDGTHVAGTNVMEDNAGTDIGVTTAYDKIDAVPMSTATTYIRQAAIGTGNYAEVVFGKLTRRKINIIGANGLLAYTSGTTSANTGGCIMSKNNFVTDTTIWGKAGALSDYSDGSTASLFYKHAILDGVFNVDQINSLKCRLGYAGDATPNPYWVNLMVEVAYSEGLSGSKHINQSVNRAGTY